MKNLFSKIKETFESAFKNLKDMVRDKGLSTVMNIFWVIICTGMLSFIAIMNVIYFPYLLTWVMLILPTILFVASVIAVYKFCNSESLFMLDVAFGIFAGMIIGASILTGSFGFIIIYGIPLFIAYISTVELSQSKSIFAQAVEG